MVAQQSSKLLARSMLLPMAPRLVPALDPAMPYMKVEQNTQRGQLPSRTTALCSNRNSLPSRSLLFTFYVNANLYVPDMSNSSSTPDRPFSRFVRDGCALQPWRRPSTLSTDWPLNAEVYALCGFGLIGGTRGMNGLTFLPVKPRRTLQNMSGYKSPLQCPSLNQRYPPLSTGCGLKNGKTTKEAE